MNIQRCLSLTHTSKIKIMPGEKKVLSRDNDCIGNYFLEKSSYTRNLVVFEHLILAVLSP